MQNKLTLVLVIIFVLFCSFSNAQKLTDDFSVSVATPYPVIDAGSKNYISLGNGTAILVKMGRGLVHIQKFDSNTMKEVAKNTYKDLPDNAYFQDVVKLKDKVFLIFEAVDKKANNFTVYCREIDTEKGTFKKQIELFKTSRIVSNPQKTFELTNAEIGFASLLAENKFSIYKSIDESKFMITYRLSPLKKSDKLNFDEIGFYVFDNNLTKVMGSEVKLPYTEEQINNIAYSVTNEGGCVMLIANREKKEYAAFFINKTGNLTEKKLDISTDLYIRKVEMKETPKGNFVCAGYYANGIEFKYNPFTGAAFVFNANGILFLEISKSGNVINKKNFDFSSDFIKQYQSKSQQKNTDKREESDKAGILDLIMREFIVKNDGSIFVVGERQYLRNEFWGPQQKPVYHFGDVVVAKINPNGDLAWMKKYPKNQAGITGAGQMGFSYMEGENFDYIAYVDNPKNISLGINEVPESHKDGLGGYLTTYKVDHKTGEFEKHTICDLNNINNKKIKAYQFKANRIFNVNKGTFLMEIYVKDKMDNMVKFVLNKN